MATFHWDNRGPWLASARELYNYFIQQSTATFHTQLLNHEGIQSMLTPTFPFRAGFLVAEDRLAGFALLTPHKPREAYAQTAEVSLYIAPEFQGQGLGHMALTELEEYAREAGFHVLLATICTENTASMGFFSAQGYEKSAHFREVGRKFGRLLDVAVFQKIL